MKEIKFEIHNQNGEVVEESVLRLKEGSKLILQVPRLTTLEQVSRLHSHVSNALEDSKNKTIIMTEDVKLKVLHIE